MKINNMVCCAINYSALYLRVEFQFVQKYNLFVYFICLTRKNSHKADIYSINTYFMDVFNVLIRFNIDFPNCLWKLLWSFVSKIGNFQWNLHLLVNYLSGVSIIPTTKLIFEAQLTGISGNVELLVLMFVGNILMVIWFKRFKICNGKSSERRSNFKYFPTLRTLKYNFFEDLKKIQSWKKILKIANWKIVAGEK